MRLIELTNGGSAVVDDEDYELVVRYRWYGLGGYARTSTICKGKRIYLKMHRVILGLADPSIHVDHIDRCGLNNQRHNLRTCTPRQNQGNCKKRCDGNASIFRGVSYMKAERKWKAQISVNGKRTHIGCFSNEVDAATAYNFAANEVFGEFANYNSPSM